MPPMRGSGAVRGLATMVAAVGCLLCGATAAAAEQAVQEFWPLGNRFETGHRIRLTLTGTPFTFLPSVPALNSIVVGGPTGAQLQFPVLPGSDLCSALGAPSCPAGGS